METNLPPEILLEIFVLALPSSLDRAGRRQFQTIRTVCSGWRAVAFASPVLWSSLHVEFYPYHGGAQNDTIPFLSQWFARSGTSIAVELYYIDLRESRPLEDTKQLMVDLLQRYQPRWKSLSLHLCEQWIFDWIHSLPKTNWYSVNSFALRMGADVNTEGVKYAAVARASQTLKCMQHLKHLTIEDHPYYDYAAPVGPRNISHLCLTDVTDFVNRHFNLISGYSQLTRLELTFDTHGRIWVPGARHLLLPRLLSLSIKTPTISLLHYFTTESLTGLDVHLPASSRRPKPQILTAFLTRCTSTLTVIQLRCSSGEEYLEKLLPCLSARPSIVKVVLDVWPYKLGEHLPLGVQERWLPDLREMAISVGMPDAWRRKGSDKLKEAQLQLGGLRRFLLDRETGGYEPLVSLTIHKLVENLVFPYSDFEDLPLEKLRVLVPY